MTVDFNRLKHFSMTYVFTDGEDMACEYEQTEQSPVVAPDGNSVSFSLRNIDQNEDQDIYSVVLVKESNDEFYIKSDYFEDAAEPYPLDVEISEDDVKFILEGEDEVMYLYGFFE
jgi:ethanolamine utilization protein EutQ (cupin superfamily)